jgi:glycosyltransferase domain-containing protein
MASPRARYTLLIPTFNRPAYLRSLLGYLAARRFRYPVRILDSSSADASAQNRETIGRGGLDIEYEVYDPATPIHAKIARGIAAVDSSYCSLCADDDVLFTDELDGLLQILDSDASLVVAHGYYVNFKPADDFSIWHTDYSAPSIVAEDALKRIVQQMSDYQAIFYGVHRTGTMKATQQPLDRVKSLWAQELLTSTLTLIAGGMYRVPRYYMARNTNPSIATEGWHPHQFLSVEPAQLLREYADYRAVALEHLAADTCCRALYRPDQVARVFDLVHLKYLAPMLSPGVMNYLIEQSLLPMTTSHQLIDGVWNRFVPPLEPPKPGRQRYLGRLAAVLYPSYAANVLKRLRCYWALYAALKFRDKFNATLELERITVTRNTRDGQPRRYLFPRTLLDQKFADGGQVTASHLRNIIRHLDDYI